MSKYSPKRQRELEQYIVSVSEREENTSEGKCETGGNTVTTDKDSRNSRSEDDDYGDTKEERHKVEDVEPEESDSPTFKVAKKRSSHFVRHDGWSVTLHFKNSKTSMKLFCYASKLLLETKAEGNGMESLRRRHGECFIKSRTLCSLLSSALQAPFCIHHRTQPFVTGFDTGCLSIEAYKHVLML